MASPDPLSETLRVTRTNWDALARLHGQDLYYDAEGLVVGLLR